MTRARERTDIYLARHDLGTECLDPEGITRLAQRINETRAQHASITRAVRRPGDREHDRSESEVGRVLREQRERERERGHDTGIEL